MNKKNVGRPRKEVNQDQLSKLASMLCTMEEMASFFDCSVDTLERNFADTIKKGKDKGKMSLRRLQWDKAQTGNTTMLIWLGKQILGQRDKIETSENNEPLPWAYD
jgi:hypothetical protein|tara:strand:- start:14488 stop:14805 length:318 start_codon:yes stop_codon:yes gene_type:complete